MESLVKIDEGGEKLLATFKFLGKVCGRTCTQTDGNGPLFVCPPILFEEWGTIKHRKKNVFNDYYN